MSSLNFKTNGCFTFNELLEDHPEHIHRMVLYVPNLNNATLLWRNWFIEKFQSCNITETHPFFSDWEFLMEPFLCNYFHQTLNGLYKLAAVPTDNFGKVVAHLFGESNLMPRWCFDIARELARPMYHEGVVYLPYLNANFQSSQGTICGLGPDVSYLANFQTWFKRVCQPSELRSPMLERLLPSPLILSDGPLILASHSEISNMRFDACYALRSLENGIPIVAPGVANHLPVFRKAEQGVMRQVRQSSVKATMVLNLARMQIVNDLPSPAIIARPDFTAAQLLEIFNNVMPVIGDQLRYWFTPITHNQIRNDWVSRAMPHAGAPPPLDEVSRFPKAVEYTSRFPTIGAYSKTPPASPAYKQSMVRAPNRSSWKGRKFKEKSEINGAMSLSSDLKKDS